MNDSSAQRDDGSRLILFVAGQSPRSRRAAAALDGAMEALSVSGEGYDLIDVLASPEKIGEFGVFATPALMRVADGRAPEVLYGELSDREKLERFLR